MTTDNDDVEQRLSQIVLSLIKAHREASEICRSESLTAAGLSSIDMVNLLLQIEDSFQVTIQSRSMNPKNFRSVETITNLIKELRSQAS